MYNIIFFYCSSNIQDNINKLSNLYKIYTKNIHIDIYDIFVLNGNCKDIENVLLLIYKNFNILYGKCFSLYANDMIDYIINLYKFLYNVQNNNYKLYLLENVFRIDRIKYIYLIISDFLKIKYSIIYIETNIDNYPKLYLNIYIIEKFIHHNIYYYNSFIIDKTQIFLNNKNSL